MYTQWGELELFLVVAEAGSFSAAARMLKTTQPTVSRRVAALEEHLGRPLFRRDVEGAHLTAEGERLLPAAQQMARWAGELSQLASGWEDKPEGRVRIAAPPGFAHDFLVPFARELRSRAPGLVVEVLAGIEHLDLSRGQAELALRTRAPTQPDLEAVLTVGVDLGVFASADYARTVGCNPRLEHIAWVTWAPPYEHLPPRPQLEKMIPGFVPGFASNDYIIQLRAVSEGLGAMILARVQDPYRREPPLVELEVQLPLPRQEMYVVCAKTMRWVPRVQLLIQELRRALERIGGATIVAG
jgi:DNA-binding transcriptional LysR family regulator